MCNISCELDSFFFCFLLILLVSILFSVSNHFVCYFRLIVEIYIEEKQTEYRFMPVIAFSKREYLLVWKLVQYTFNDTYLSKGICCERSKQTVNASPDWYKIPLC